jgi:CHASE3 domain sensor protein
MTRVGNSGLLASINAGLFRDLGLPGLMASLVLFVSAMTLLGTNLSELRASYVRVRQTNEALLQIATINTTVLRVELAARGYIVSGDPEFVRRQALAHHSLQMQLVKLDEIVGADAHEHQDVVMLTKLLNEHGAYFEDLTKQVVTDRAQAIAKMLDYSRTMKRRPIDNLLAHLRNDETVRLVDLERNAERRVLLAYRCAIAISAIALMLGGFGFAMILQDRHTRRRERPERIVERVN